MSTKAHTVQVRTAPTPFGVHYWTSWLKCPTAAWLDELARKERDPSQLSGVIYFDVGSLGHALLALHYSLPPQEALKLDTRKLKWMTSGGPLDKETYAEALEEADRLYRAYRAHWGAGDLGKVLGIEHELETQGNLGDPTRDAPILTGGLDLVVRLTAAQLKRSNLDGEPGVYVVDHKFYSRPDPATYELALHDMQFAMYPELWDRGNPTTRDACKGTIVNLIYKKLPPSFERLLLPRRALQLEARVFNQAQQAAASIRNSSLEAVKAGGAPFANIAHCFKRSSFGWDFCAHYKSGVCKRGLQRKPRAENSAG